MVTLKKLDNSKFLITSTSLQFSYYIHLYSYRCFFFFFVENEPDINILVRANELLEILERASELKKMKCYDPSTLELKPGKKK